MTHPPANPVVEAVTAVIAGHFGWRDAGDMADNRGDLRAKFRGADQPTPPYDMNEPTWVDCEEAARAALQALADTITPEMVSAGMRYHPYEASDPKGAWHETRLTIRAALRAALGDDGSVQASDDAPRRAALRRMVALDEELGFYDDEPVAAEKRHD